MARLRCAPVWAALLAAGWIGHDPAQAEERGDGFMQMSLEQLMSVEVTSVAGVGREWFTTPAAMYVITDEDVRRSGHRSIAEALRLSPGVHVAQITSNTWAISTRGFNSRFANKQLVLIDGRTVYDPLFGGVFWDVQDVLLEDLDRIEVIRGPGATLWGANAVQGVINITTKSAKDTQGLYASAGGGTYDRLFGETRYGFQIDDSSWMRIWGKWQDKDHFVHADGSDAHDEWDMARGGFRYDREGGDDTTFTLEGDLYHSDRLGEQVKIPLTSGGFGARATDGRASGGHILFRIARETPEQEGFSLQGYYDRTDRAGAGGFRVERDTFDLEFRHILHLWERHEVIWGLGYRHSRDRTRANDFIEFDPADRSLDTFTAFVQDTITLIPDTLYVMVGSKFEHNDFTGFEVQPSGRAWWTPDDRHTVWGAISRPVRVPARTENVNVTVAHVPLGPGLSAPVFIDDNDALNAEHLLACELGHRFKLTDDLTVDTAVFYNDYNRLIALSDPTPVSFFPTPPFPPGVPTALMIQQGNTARGRAYGVETAVTWRVAENWRLQGSYSFLNMHVRGNNVLDDPEHGHPHHMAQIRSYLDITRDLEFNAALYFVDNVASQDADAYLRLDLGLTWRPTANLELAVWGQNLTERSHREFNDALFLSRPAEVPRAVYVEATVRF
jgi:iron complex outermembrane recepter protein